MRIRGEILVGLGLFQLERNVDELASGKLWIAVDLSSAAAQAAEVAEAQVVDVDELAQHVEVLDDLRRLDRLESPHVLRPHSSVLVSVCIGHLASRPAVKFSPP